MINIQIDLLGCYAFPLSMRYLVLQLTPIESTLGRLSHYSKITDSKF